VREVLCDILSTEGHEVASAANGHEGINISFNVEQIIKLIHDGME